ncbi:hypothetical protein CEUSTIGMA_g640.t1 [Chlamydomonas eustigma]|uniref:SNF2 N-terminal domain-containing protein n=1 Tax=Chlamydomonas eustigma TaxID=1157962 RepID=A0A250WQR8_9CHLO|nr:hypothetical protein CEUSTIGMA_g640.t1 [Chlamydomonas eustigma]|eukprot:GAX73187.1 hypothetical protein CEUSTIGMA_g640.t1 [Chlamydomonas eustigma]
MQCSGRDMRQIKQNMVEILNQTCDAVNTLLSGFGLPSDSNQAQKLSRAPSSCLNSAIEQRKRKRNSPHIWPPEHSFSATHLPAPRTPTQDLLPSLTGELRSHQLEGVKWLWHMYKSGLNSIMSDELLKDRQVQVVGFLALLKTKGIGGPFLIVAPSTALSSWSAELHRLLPQGLLVHMYAIDSGSRDMLPLICCSQGRQEEPLTRVVLMSCKAFEAEAPSLCQFHFKSIIIDTSSTRSSPNLLDCAHKMPGIPALVLVTSAHPAEHPDQGLDDVLLLSKFLFSGTWHQIHDAIIELLGYCSNQEQRAMTTSYQQNMQMAGPNPDHGQQHEMSRLPAQQRESNAAALFIADLRRETTHRLQSIIDRFVLMRTAEEVDLMQPRRDTAINLYDYFSGTG